MSEQAETMINRNPLSRVQHEIAELLRKSEWMNAHRVEIIEQNSQSMSYLLKRSVAQINNVVVIVGTDEMTNNPPVLEAVTTLTATENVTMNRVGESYATALDVAQVALEIIDGREWKFEDLRHTTPTDGVLQATVTFRGQVTRDTANAITKGQE